MSSSNRLVVLARGKPWHNYGDVNIKENKNKPAKKPKAAQPIIYPVLAEGAEYVTDTYWKEILIKAAMGSFPRYFHFSDETLTYKVKNKVQRKFLKFSEPENCAKEIVSFMKESAGFFSPYDVEELNKEEVFERPPITWKSLKHNSSRNSYMKSYIKMVANMLSLSPDEISNLERILNIGILGGVFDNSTIIIQDEAIVKINGLIYDPSTKTFSIGEKFRKKKKVEAEEEDLDYGKMWRKYILILKKNHEKYRSTCLRIN